MPIRKVWIPVAGMGIWWRIIPGFSNDYYTMEERVMPGHEPYTFRIITTGKKAPGFDINLGLPGLVEVKADWHLKLLAAVGETRQDIESDWQKLNK